MYLTSGARNWKQYDLVLTTPMYVCQKKRKQQNLNI